MADLLDPRHCVSNNLHQTARAISRVYGEEMRSAGLKRSQFAILATLSKTGPTMLTRLAEQLVMERTTLTRNLKPLSDKGLVCVRQSRSDARAREISLTQAGKSKLEEAMLLWQQAQKRVVEAYGEDNWRDLEAALTTLRSLPV